MSGIDNFMWVWLLCFVLFAFVLLLCCKVRFLDLLGCWGGLSCALVGFFRFDIWGFFIATLLSR